MTKQAGLKQQIRTRAAKTGESYTAARAQIISDRPRTIRLAVAQVRVHGDPGDEGLIRDSGDRVRALIREAAAGNCRLVVFPEGAMISPAKRIVSSDPDRMAEADWSRTRWDVLAEELVATAKVAAEKKIWVALGGIDWSGRGTRPTNCLRVISDRGQVRARYDERMLSATKSTFMYTPGTDAVSFTVDRVRFGCTLGMEAHFPEIFAAYEQDDVDAVLVPTTGIGTANATFADHAQALASMNSYWVAYAVPTDAATDARSGLISPTGEWVAQCPLGEDGLAVADLDLSRPNFAREWRRVARSKLA